MSLPSKLPVLALVCVMLAAGIAAAVFVRNSGQINPVILTAGTILEPRRELPPFALTDHRGQPFTNARLRGQWSLLFFGFTNCPDLCPTTLTALAAVEKRLRAAASPRPQVVFVSVDAKRDTPAQLSRYVPFFDPEFIGVTAADQAAIESFARQLGVAVIIGPERDGNYSVDHSAAIFVVAPDGRLAAILTGPNTVESVFTDFQRIAALGA